MRYRTLGETGIEVSELCLGVLTVGPLQEDLSPGEGGRVIRHALERGITFLDTAEAYGTYPHIRAALRGCPVRPVVATKSYAHTGEDMRRSLERARREMDLDVIDLFLLHEQESEATLRGHQQALEFLVEARERGLVRAVGISTHSVRGAVAGALHPLVQVIHPLLNLAGLGIMDGSREQMQAAIALARLRGKGVYAMKALGGGNLISRAREALAFVRSVPFVDAVAVGMKSVDEVELNLAWAEGRTDDELQARVGAQPRRLHVEAWCSGCGSCLEACRYGALSLHDQRVQVDAAGCLLCGYCAGSCPDFCIKVV